MAEPNPRKPTSAQQRNEGPQQYPKLVFVSHEASKSTSEHNTVIGHGRRLQLDKRNREKKRSAQQEATYARSLVGWNSPAATAEPPSAGGSDEAEEGGEPRVHGTSTLE